MVLWVLIMLALLHQVTCTDELQPSFSFEAKRDTSLAKAAEPLCQETQRAALLEFYNSAFNGTTTGGWFSSPTADCCDWAEVTCDSSGFVLSLYIPAYNIHDELHFNASPLAKLHLLKALELDNIDFDTSEIALFSSTLTSLRIADPPSYATGSPLPWAALTARLLHLTDLELSKLPALDGTTLSLELCNLTHLKTLAVRSINGLRDGIPSCLSILPHLVYLDLAGNDLKGPIPQHWNLSSPLKHLYLGSNLLTGFIYPSLLGWKLEVIDLSANNLTGSIPQSIGNCTKLTTLLMGNNELSGEIPDQWGKLVHLEQLDLSGNRFLGEIPASIGQLGLNTSFRIDLVMSIDLSSNSLTGSLPWSLLFTNVVINELKLGFNNLTGRLCPDSGELHSNYSGLVTLDLSHNSLIGHTPSCISSMNGLQHLNLSHNMLERHAEHESFSNVSTVISVLDLSFNHLAGRIPTWLSTLISLESLFLSSNQLHGPVPPWLWSLPQLSKIDISDNQLSGDIPLHQWLKCNVPQVGLGNGPIFKGFKNNFSRLVMASKSFENCSSGLSFYLDLHSNDLSGEIPWMGVLSYGSYNGYLNLADNRLTGEFPEEAPTREGQWIDFLETLDLSHNFLSGKIPGWLGGQGTGYLQLSFNNFWGEIPSGLCRSIVGGEGMVALKLGHNSLSGAIPDEFGDACGELKSLVLSDNLLTGPMPSLTNLSSSLVVLDLSRNQLEGGLPAWLQQMQSLRVLSLSFNSLSGPLPSTVWNTTKLQVLDLSNNNLSGSISAQSLSHLQGFVDSLSRETLFNASQTTLYDESVTIRGKGAELQFTYLLTATVSLDVSNNELNGPIPPELGFLNGLVFLNLSNNHLTGQIPGSLSNLTQLSSLDVSANGLEGQISGALCSLTFLAYVNLSRNALRGPIPLCTQWGTFSPNSFAGNQGLCGPPLAVPCPSNTTATQEQGSSNGVHAADHDLLMAIVVGVCVAFPFVFATTFLWWPADHRLSKASQWIIAKLHGSARSV